jgi:anti-anti-sigma factor
MNDPIATIRLTGELEINRKAEIRHALTFSENARGAVIDLSEVTYADSTALTELLRFCAGLQRDEVPVAVVIRTPQLSRLVQYAGLSSAFKIFNDIEKARRYVAAALE